MIQRKHIIDVTLTPAELAREFSKLDDEQQAMFYNELAILVQKWVRPFCFQLQSIVDSPVLTTEGRAIMRDIANYGETYYKEPTKCQPN